MLHSSAAPALQSWKMWWQSRLSSRTLWLARLVTLLCIFVLLAIASFKPVTLESSRQTLRTNLYAPLAEDSRRVRARVMHSSANLLPSQGRNAAGANPFDNSKELAPKAQAVPDHEYAVASEAIKWRQQQQQPHVRQSASEDPLAFPKEARAADAEPDAYLALCLAVKSSQVSELSHWIEHHLKLGVRKFYIYDESKISLAEDLEDLVTSGLVDYLQLQEPVGQLNIYKLCLAPERRKLHRFMGFIDSDEFLVLRKEGDLPSLLHQFEGDFGGIGVNWRLFGSSGHLEKPAGPVTENFWKCVPGDEPQSRHIKSIVNTENVEGVGADPHTFRYQNGRYAATTAGERIDGFLSDTFTEDSLVLFHYVTKSREEFEEKMARGSGMGNHRQWDFFEEIDSKSTDDCTDLLTAPVRARRKVSRRLAASAA